MLTGTTTSVTMRCRLFRRRCEKLPLKSCAITLYARRCKVKCDRCYRLADPSSATEQLQRVNGDTTKFKREVARTREALVAAQRAEVEKDTKVCM